MKKVLALGALLLLAFETPVHAIPIVDSLGIATPETQFSIFGSGGVSILPTQFVGPQFTLAESTVLTEIGGFVNSFTGTAPFTVQIRPSTAGSPDPSTVLASLLLSSDGNSLVTSYESVAANLLLGPGSYYALFASLDGSQGYLLGSASDPFEYLSGLSIQGCLGTSCGNNPPADQYGAVRILGNPVVAVPEPSTLSLLVLGLVWMVLKRRETMGHPADRPVTSSPQ